MKRIRRNPDPRIRSALTRQYWSSAEQVSVASGVPKDVCARRLAKMFDRGEVQRQPGAGGAYVYRRAS